MTLIPSNIIIIMIIIQINLIETSDLQISNKDFRQMYPCPFTKILDCDDYYRKIKRNFDSDYKSNKKTKLVISVLERWMMAKGDITTIYIPRILPTFGKHICTRRPCDCYIQNCFAYCAWNWCHAQPLADLEEKWIYIECIEDFNLEACLYYEWPCQEYC